MAMTKEFVEDGSVLELDEHLVLFRPRLTTRSRQLTPSRLGMRAIVPLAKKRRGTTHGGPRCGCGCRREMREQMIGRRGEGPVEES